MKIKNLTPYEIKLLDKENYEIFSLESQWSVSGKEVEEINWIASSQLSKEDACYMVSLENTYYIVSKEMAYLGV